ncbi:hypothetical protein D4R78_07505 [bacterium]|nr:MAG: hypothetical protein D4R78_07505 [bacterium]
MHKAQATLEFTIFFVIMAALSLGLIGLWKSSSDTIVKRQIDYNATRVQKGSTPAGSSSPGNIPLEFTYNVIDPSLLDPLNSGSVSSYSLLTLSQISNNLDSINKAISDIQANIPKLVNLRDTWKSFFDQAEAQDATAQQQVNALQAQLDAKQKELDEKTKNNQCGCSGEDCTDPCVTLSSEISYAQVELEKATNGYYTIEYSCGEGDTCITYDSSNSQWAGRFSTRDEWTKDYWVYRQYGVSKGNNQYGLYTNYTPGLLDWQSRKAYSQSQMNDSQSNLDKTESVLAKLTAMRDKLLEAQASKS